VQRFTMATFLWYQHSGWSVVVAGRNSPCSSPLCSLGSE
jgi:hypothetical protein